MSTSNVVDPVRPYRGVRVQLTESDDEDNANHQNHTQEDEYQSFVTGNNQNNNSTNSRLQSLRQFFSWNRGSNNNNNNTINSATDDNIVEEDQQAEETRSPSLFSNVGPNARRRVLVLIIISILFIVIIAIHFILVAAFVKPSSASSDSEKESSDSSNANNFRTVLLYTLTIPNAILFSCIAFCCTCLWGKRLLALCLNHNRSTWVRNLKYYLLKYGLVRYEGEHDDWEGEEISERNQRLLELLQSRGMDVNSLRLMMVDRDFNANDYETLLQLDGRHTEPRGVSENTLSRLTLYRIPPLSAVEHSNDDSELYTGTPSAGATAHNDQDSSVPYCSENLGRTLLEESCCICLSKYESGDVVCTLPTCLHRYHRDCVFQALRMRNQCPICKTAV